MFFKCFEHSCSHRTIATHEMVKALLCVLPVNWRQFKSNTPMFVVFGGSVARTGVLNHGGRPCMCTSCDMRSPKTTVRTSVGVEVAFRTIWICYDMCRVLSLSPFVTHFGKHVSAFDQGANLKHSEWCICSWDFLSVKLWEFQPPVFFIQTGNHSKDSSRFSSERMRTWSYYAFEWVAVWYIETMLQLLPGRSWLAWRTFLYESAITERTEQPYAIEPFERRRPQTPAVFMLRTMTASAPFWPNWTLAL